MNFYKIAEVPPAWGVVRNPQAGGLCMENIKTKKVNRKITRSVLRNKL